MSHFPYIKYLLYCGLLGYAAKLLLLVVCNVLCVVHGVCRKCNGNVAETKKIVAMLNSAGQIPIANEVIIAFLSLG
jgi:hypothetical protein